MAIKIERRTLLGASAALAALAAPVPWLLDPSARAKARPAGARSGRLVRDSAGLCDLPPGFTYTMIDRAGERLADGHAVPERPDGMACFAGENGALVLMRNHELDRTRPAAAPVLALAPAEAYDRSAFGGVTRVVIDPKTLRRVSSNLVLTGTLRNCAGGPSPWGWLSCEESVEPGHGYVFRCPTDAARLAKPERIVGYGRFNHEAVCIDPRTHAAYLTEDRTDGCLYRFLPRALDRPFDGELQALRVQGAARFDLGSALRAGQKLAVEWVRVPEPDPADDSVREQVRELGAAVVRRGEGIWFHGDAVYVCSTIGGRRGSGQILRLRLSRSAAPDRLELFAESTDPSVLDMPDNITVAPWGDVYLAEDGAGEQYLRGITPEGRVFDVARNARSRGELAGACFSPDGSTLFLNLQIDGITLAVRGPFRELAGKRS